MVFWEWKQPKATGGYVGTVRRLSKQCDTVFTQKLLHKIRWMRWRVIVVKKPVTAHMRVISKILFEISQTVVFGIPRSFSSSRTVNRRSPSIASHTRSILSNVFVVECRPERESLLTEVRPPLKRLYHSFICVLLIHSFPKAFCIIWIVSELVFPSWEQNLMHLKKNSKICLKLKNEVQIIFCYLKPLLSASSWWKSVSRRPLKN